jgi:hypothetical protein
MQKVAVTVEGAYEQASVLHRFLEISKFGIVLKENLGMAKI